MPENLKIVYNIEYVKSFEFSDFIESLFMRDSHSTNWLEGYYFSLGNSTIIRLDSRTVLISYDGLAYTKHEFSPYVTIKTKDHGLEIKGAKSVNPRSQDPYWIKIERIEPYDFGQLRDLILKSIEEVEKLKKEHEKSEN